MTVHKTAPPVRRRFLRGAALVLPIGFLVACGTPAEELYPNTQPPVSETRAPILDPSLPPQDLVLPGADLDRALISTYQDSFEGTPTWYVLNENARAATIVFLSQGTGYEAVLAQPGQPLPLGFTPVDIIDLR